MQRSIAALRPTLALSLVLALVGCAPSPGAAAAEETRGDGSLPAGMQSLAGFVENRGQWDEDVLFFARSAGVEATLVADALVLRPAPTPEAEAVRPLVLRLPASETRERRVEGEGEAPTRHHFFHGGRSASDARGFASVLYRDVAPGIDVRVTKRDGRFAYDLLVAPGARVEDVVLEVEGAEGLERVAPDLLSIRTSSGVVEQRIGACWQVDPETGVEEPVACRFRIRADGGSSLAFGFEAPGRDPLAALVLDPSFLFSTYVGGSSSETSQDVLVDVGPDGSVYLACTSGGGTPTTPGSFQPSEHPGINAWVGKLSPDGTTLEWGAFLGGSMGVMTTNPAAIEVAPDGSVLVAGATWSEDFPTTPGAYQETFAGKNDTFVSKISSDGSTLLWSTFFGGSDHEQTWAATLLPSGDLVVAIEPWAEIQTTPGVFDPVYDEGDLLLVRFAADGSSIVFATYFKTGRILDMASDAESNLYLAGDAGLTSIPIPTTPGAFQEEFGSGTQGKAFVAKMDPLGTEVLWCTYFGGDEGGESAWGIAVDAASAVYITGDVTSDDMPLTPGTFSDTITGGVDGYVAKFLPGGSDLVWSTYLGACCGGAGSLKDVQVDAAGNAHVVGAANESSYPVTPDALQPFHAGSSSSSDSYITKLDAFAEDLVYSSWFGGTSTDHFPQIALTPDGDPVIAVKTWSSDAPITPGAFQREYAGSGDMLVAGFHLGLLPWRVLGGGLAGAADTPYLAGAGALVPATPTRLSLRGGVSGAPAWIVAGTAEAGLPLLGGTLVPAPEILHPLPLGPSGGFDLVFPWPPLPAGTELTFQLWSLDLGAPQGWSASNAIRAIAQ